MITNILLLAILFLLMAIFFSLQRGFNQVISGVAAIHQRHGATKGEAPEMRS